MLFLFFFVCLFTIDVKNASVSFLKANSKMIIKCRIKPQEFIFVFCSFEKHTKKKKTALPSCRSDLARI